MGVLEADLLGVVEAGMAPVGGICAGAAIVLRLRRPGPELGMLSEPGLLGGESLTVGPMMPGPAEPAPTLLK